MEGLVRAKRRLFRKANVAETESLKCDMKLSNVTVNAGGKEETAPRIRDRGPNIVQALVRREVGGSRARNNLRWSTAVLIGPTLVSEITGAPAATGDEKKGEEEEKRAETIGRGLPNSAFHSPSLWKVWPLVESDHLYQDALNLLLAGPSGNSYIHDTSTSNPLRLACENGNPVAIRCLLKAGTNPNISGKGKINALHILLGHAYHFCVFGQYDVHGYDLTPALIVDFLRMFLEAGADLSARDSHDRTPLHLAAAEGYVAAAEVLLTSPGCVRYENGQMNEYELNVKSRYNLGLNVNVCDEKGNTPLHRAMNEGMAKLLISHGAHVNVQDLEGKTPLHVAVSKAKTDVVRVLISSGADVHAVDKSGRTALQYAATTDVEELALLLLAAGARVNDSLAEGPTALHTAAEFCCCSVAKVLISSGANINAVDSEGNTPLHYTADVHGYHANFEGDSPILRFVWCGPDTLIDSREIRRKRPEMAELLIAAGAHVNARNAELRTPLHVVALRGEIAMAEVLVNSAAEVNALDIKGKTAYDIVAKVLRKQCKPWIGESRFEKLVLFLAGSGAKANKKSYCQRFFGNKVHRNTVKAT